MYWIFAMVCLLLLAFNLEPVTGRPAHGYYVLIWSLNDTLTLVHIVRKDWYVLVDDQTCYLYVETDSTDTYIPAIRLDNKRTYNIIHYRYVLDWVSDPPVLKTYPQNDALQAVEILNHVTAQLAE